MVVLQVITPATASTSWRLGLYESGETAEKNISADAIVFTQINKYNTAADAGVITCITKYNSVM